LKVDGAVARGRLRDLGLRQGQVADAIGISRQHLSHVLCGRTGASAWLVRKIAEHLDLPEEALAVMDGAVRRECRTRK
jgi:transcriptional regulator with XRE-family HTH domain